MHAGAGTILFYHDLAQRLGPEQPIYGLQAQGLYGKATPHATVEEMAAHYIQEIRTVQPDGPYRLAGFCFGAILAFEMAQQLRKRGRGGGKVNFEHWNEAVTITPPSDAIDISQLRSGR